MRNLLRRRQQKGFTLIELLIVVAIIGIIAALLIPNLLDALNKARQKKTMAEARNVGTAWFSWLTDVSSAAAAGVTVNFDSELAASVSHSVLETILVSPSNTGHNYIQEVPPVDGWKNPFDYRAVTDISTASNLATLLRNPRVMGIRSNGRHGDTDSSGSYKVGSFMATDYDQDIVWIDGFFIREPAGLGGS